MDLKPLRPADVVSFRYYDEKSGVWDGEGVVLNIDGKYLHIQTAKWVKYNHKLQETSQPNELLRFELDHWLKGYLEINIIDN